MPATDAEDLYGEFYFTNYLTEEGRVSYGREEIWQRLFAMVAQRIVDDLHPASVLDAGCAMGLLVENLRDRGVDAYGIDISSFAIEHVREDMRPYCRVGSVTDELDRDYDLIVCVEVLEHLQPAEAELAVANFCRHSRQVLFSSSPLEFREETHFNVRPPEYWAQAFARHGFYRDVDYDASTYLNPFAVRFQKRPDVTTWELVTDYERSQWRLRLERAELRKAAGERREEVAWAVAERDEAQARIEAMRGTRAWRFAERFRKATRTLRLR